MPRRETGELMKEFHSHRAKLLIGLGVLIFVVGLLRSFGVSWNAVFMVVGILILLKGLYLKSKKR